MERLAHCGLDRTDYAEVCVHCGCAPDFTHRQFHRESQRHVGNNCVAF